MPGRQVVWPEATAAVAMLTCEEIAQLVSQSLDRQLSFPERLMVRFHLLYCKACRRYRRQVEFLRLAIRRYLDQIEAGEETGLPGLSESARERMARVLRQS